MMKTILTLASGVILAGTATAAGAQASPGAPMPTTPPPPMRSSFADPDSFARKDYDLRQAGNQKAATYATAQEIAHCVFGKSRGKAAEFLGGEMTADPSYQNLQRALGGKYDECVSSTALNVRMSVVDGALAEELLREKPPVADALVPANADAANAFYNPSAGLSVTTLGRCLAAYSPAAAYRLLSTPANSAAEKDALKAVYASSTQCGGGAVPADITVEQQRGAIASGLYHWLHRG